MDTWETYLEEATTAGNEISEEMKIGHLLSKLPKSWNTFITMNSQGKSLSDLITKVRHENLRRQLKNSTPSMAMTATVNKPQKSSYNNRYKPKFDNYKYTEVSNSIKGNESQRTSSKQLGGGFKLVYRYCKREGHIERVCRFKQFVENKKQPQANNVILEDKSDDKSECYLESGGDYDDMPEEGNIIQAYHIIAEESKTDYDTWYLDTGVTHHLTYRRDWLDDYQVLSNQLQVIFGDKGKKSAIGKGTIKIKLSKDHQITVHNVYYVPGLEKHLLSVEQAIVDGLTIQFCRDKAIL